jgi:hypothetical protein
LSPAGLNVAEGWKAGICRYMLTVGSAVYGGDFASDFCNV